MTTTIRASVRQVQIPAGRYLLPGELTIPEQAIGLVVFAHGSGSSRFSPRNQRVAADLQQAGLGTLLFDLLTETESETRANVFDLPLLADRLLAATEWLALQPDTGDLRVGYFGASTGGGAALIAAAKAPDRVHAVVSRGGRPDLAGEWLPKVEAPTLLIVGGLDTAVIGLNQMAFDKLHCVKSFSIVRGATHLFEEAGTLERVSHLARDWFGHHLRSPAPVAH
ncbi:MAG TPA: alpha/beta fold hydrolase [Gemmatimonadales bacterium]|nr:alpha/beta fold hydrolase [Gemmatimonadales bacterium]